MSHARREELLRRFPNASEGFLQINGGGIPTCDAGQVAQLECDLGDGALGKKEIAAQRVNNMDKKHGNLKPPVVKICPHCGKSFEISPPSFAFRRKYCSTICKYASRQFRESIGNKLRKDRGTAVCKGCGCEFVPTRNSGKAEFCSQPCAASFNGKITMGKNRITEHCYSRGKKGWKEVGGVKMFFRSLWESNYAYYLEFLKLNGQIKKWEHEPETFWFAGIKRGVRSYLPDFRVTENSGKVVYHEVKGWMDPKSITKLKRMKKYHPSVNMFVADSTWYKANSKKLKGIVNGWQ